MKISDLVCCERPCQRHSQRCSFCGHERVRQGAVWIGDADANVVMCRGCALGGVGIYALASMLADALADAPDSWEEPEVNEALRNFTARVWRTLARLGYRHKKNYIAKGVATKEP